MTKTACIIVSKPVSTPVTSLGLLPGWQNEGMERLTSGNVCDFNPSVTVVPCCFSSSNMHELPNCRFDREQYERQMGQGKGRDLKQL